MTINVTGIFNNRSEAETAITELFNAGFDKDDISLIITDSTRDKLISDRVKTVEGDEGSRAAKGGVAGAVMGGTLGAILAGLTAVGTVVIPGAGLLVVGPIIAVLSGAGVGATVGGLTGALVGAGYPNDEATRYEEAIKAGKVLVIVHVEDESRAPMARAALRNTVAYTKVA